MLEQVEEFRRGIVLRPCPLLQPFLVGVGQRAVGAAEAEDRRCEGWRQAGFLAQALDFTGGKQRRQGPAQAQGFGVRRSAAAQGLGLGMFAFEQQQGLEPFEALRVAPQALAQVQSTRGLPAWGCHVFTSLSDWTSTVRTKRLAVA
ncbi:hypothetical protein D3C84_841950 [compost metagenome]